MANEGFPSSSPSASLPGTVSNANRLVSVQGAQTVKESQILDAVTGGVWTLSATFTANRGWTVPDRNDTFAGLQAQTFLGPQTINAGTVAQQRSLKLIGGDGAGNPGGLYLTSATATGQDAATVEAVGQRNDANGSSGFCGQLGLAHLRTDTAMVSSGVSLGRVKFGGNPTDTTLGNVVYSAQIRGYASSAWSSSAAMPTGILFSTGSAGIASGSTSEAGTDAVWIDHLGNTGFGVAPTAGNGLLQLASGTTKANGIAFGTDTFLYRSSAAGLLSTGWFTCGDGTQVQSQILNGTNSGTGGGARWRLQNGGTEIGQIGNLSAFLGTAYDSTLGILSASALKLYSSNTLAVTIDTSQNVGIGGSPTASQGLLQLPTSAGITTSIKLGTGYLYQRSTLPSALTWDAGSTTTAAWFVQADSNAVRGYMGISAVPKVYLGSQSNHAVDINTNNTTAITIDTAQGVTTAAANYVKVRSVVSAASTTTLDASDATAILTGTTTHTFTLPAAANGRRLYMKNRSTGALTVNRAGSDTIDGGTTLNVAAGAAKILIANGTDWCVWNA